MDSNISYYSELIYPVGNIQPLDQFSTEDNNLLMSVLNSNSIQDQYSTYHPLVMWDLNYFDPSMQSDNSTQSGLNNCLYQYEMNTPKLNDFSPNKNSTSQEYSSEDSTIKSENDLENIPKEDNKNEDDESIIEIQKNKRRESQNRASRNYRQRKKVYIKEIEKRLEELKLENEQLRNENQKNRRVINQFRSIIEKPPLLRSYSTELQLVDEEIEKIVSQLRILTYNGVREDDPELKKLLNMFHQHVDRRQKILQKDALQLVNPKLQEKLARLEGIPTLQTESKISEWLQEASQFVNDEQVIKLRELKKRYLEGRAKIWEERNDVRNEIKDFYQNKIAIERLNYTGKIDPDLVHKLQNKLELLKKNFIKETELCNEIAADLSSILTPYQEAIITIKHYNIYKERVTSFHMLNSIWNYLSNEY